jgi:hypothetical protein
MGMACLSCARNADGMNQPGLLLLPHPLQTDTMGLASRSLYALPVWAELAWAQESWDCSSRGTGAASAERAVCVWGSPGKEKHREREIQQQQQAFDVRSEREYTRQREERTIVIVYLN